MVTSISSSYAPSSRRLKAPLECRTRSHPATGSSKGGEPYTEKVLLVLRSRPLGPKLEVASGTRLTLIPIFSQSSATASITSGPSCATSCT